MKITRKEFEHPSGSFVKNFLWWGCEKKEEQKWVGKTLTEFRQEAIDFINSIGPEKIVSINEHTSMKKKHGDDKVTHIVIWYWEE